MTKITQCDRCAEVIDETKKGVKIKVYVPSITQQML
jgi:hypothetical protein